MINKINEEYYSADFKKTIAEIAEIDKTLSDDEYLKQVFKCLDEYSEYYTADEYESSVAENTAGMIAATYSKNNVTVKINRFGKGIEEKFRVYMNECADKKIQKLILDLTDCPGGYVSVMNDIANMILPKGKTFTAEFKNSEKVYYSQSEQCPFKEIEVKVSAKTASAAEILAAALREAGVATVTGVNTYGKTSIQSIYRLENGGAFKLTCGKYLTRNGNDISKVGLSPDVIDYSYPIKIRWNEYSKAILKNEVVSE